MRIIFGTVLGDELKFVLHADKTTERGQPGCKLHSIVEGQGGQKRQPRPEAGLFLLAVPEYLGLVP